jgi:hypothetical protein
MRPGKRLDSWEKAAHPCPGKGNASGNLWSLPDGRQQQAKKAEHGERGWPILLIS